jgi:hypothetical protein
MPLGICIQYIPLVIHTKTSTLEQVLEGMKMSSPPAAGACRHVYLEGGGWCTSTRSCAGRAETVLGSSSPKYHAATLSLPRLEQFSRGGLNRL